MHRVAMDGTILGDAYLLPMKQRKAVTTVTTTAPSWAMHVKTVGYAASFLNAIFVVWLPICPQRYR